MTFYTFAGTGERNDVPYRVHVWFDATDKRVYSTVTTPAVRAEQVGMAGRADGDPSHAAGLGRRRVADPVQPACALHPRAVLDRAVGNGDVTPAVLGPVVLAENEVLSSVLVTIGDQDEARNLVTQQVRLVNLS